MFRWISKLFSKPASGSAAPQVLQDSGSDKNERDVFRFAPELFEVRTDVIAELGERGFDWLSHFSAVDLSMIRTELKFAAYATGMMRSPSRIC